MRLGKIEKEILIFMAKEGNVVPVGATRLEREMFRWYSSVRGIIGERLGYLYKKNKQWHLMPSFSPAYCRAVRSLISKGLITWVKIVEGGFEVADIKHSGGISLTQRGKLRARGINIGRAKKMRREKLKSKRATP